MPSTRPNAELHDLKPARDDKMEGNGCQNILEGEQKYLLDPPSSQRSDIHGPRGGWVRWASRHNEYPPADDYHELFLFKPPDLLLQLCIDKETGHLSIVDERTSVELTRSPLSLFQRIFLTKGSELNAGMVGDTRW